MSSKAKNTIILEIEDYRNIMPNDGTINGTISDGESEIDSNFQSPTIAN